MRKHVGLSKLSIRSANKLLSKCRHHCHHANDRHRHNTFGRFSVSVLVLGEFVGVDHRAVNNIHVIIPFSGSVTADMDAAAPGHIRLR